MIVKATKTRSNIFYPPIDSAAAIIPVSTHDHRQDDNEGEQSESDSDHYPPCRLRFAFGIGDKSSGDECDAEQKNEEQSEYCRRFKPYRPTHFLFTFPVGATPKRARGASCSSALLQTGRGIAPSQKPTRLADGLELGSVLREGSAVAASRFAPCPVAGGTLVPPRNPSR